MGWLWDPSSSELFAQREEQIGETGVEAPKIGDGKSRDREDRYWIQREVLAQVIEG